MQCSRCGAALSAKGMCLACGSLVQVDAGGSIAAGTLIGQKYEVVEQIGAGGMGKVYRAIQRPLGVEVCVKTLHTGAISDPQFLTRFEREAKTTSQLSHPNIVTVTDFGTHSDGSLYLVMEYVRGVSLAEETKGRRIMSAPRATHILVQLCDALSAAHAQKVIHRDIKPGNVMLTDVAGRTDFVKVLDFGSALMLDAGEEGERLTRTGTVIGTAAYMAPEYILGRGVDARVDVYAVGTLLYRLLCGSTPFRGEMQSIFAQQVSVAPERPRDRNPEADVSPEMETVILRALAKDPARRYGSSADLKAAMMLALTGVGESAYELVEGAEMVGVEVAPQERAIVVLSVQGAQGLSEQDVARLVESGNARGAQCMPLDSGVTFVFGLDREGPEAAEKAMRFALEMVNGDWPELCLGMHDAQSTLRGRPGHPAFGFEMFGEGESLAWALASHAVAGQVLISGPVSRHVPPELRLTPITPPSTVREPVFVLSNAQQADGTLGRLPLAGRSAEQRALIEIAVNAKAGRICVLKGQEGIGKSRLVNDVISHAGRLGVLWCVVPAGRGRHVGPAHPVSVVSALGWSIPGGSTSTTERYAVDLMLGRTDRSDGLSGERRLLRLVSAAIDGLARRLTHGPVVLVLDDLHEADDLTWALAHRLVEAAPVLGGSVVLCVRDEAMIPFSLPSDANIVEIAPLTEREGTALASHALGTGSDPAVAASVARSSRGVPLLEEEILRAVRSGNDAIVADLAELSPRQAVECLVAGRIAALDESARWVLAAAAVLGMEPDERELADVLEDPDLAAWGSVELHTSGLLVRDAARISRFAFPAVREAALASIPSDARRDLHTRAAALIARSETAATRLVEISEHQLSAGLDREAFDSLRRAAEIARGDGETRRAANCLKLAVAAAGRLGADNDRLLVQREYGRALLQLGQLEAAEETLRTAYHDARTAEAIVLAADLLRMHGRVLVLQGDLETGQREIEGTLRFAEGAGHVAIAADACADLADAAERANDPAQTARALRRGLALIEGSHDVEVIPVRIQLFNRLARLELQSGNLSGAIALFTQALDLAERCNDKYQAAGLLGNLGGSYAKKGENATALHFTERALQASERLGDQIGVARQSFNLALLRVAAGQTKSARQLLRNSFDAARRAGWREGLGMSSAALAKLAD